MSARELLFGRIGGGCKFYLKRKLLFILFIATYDIQAQNFGIDNSGTLTANSFVRTSTYPSSTLTSAYLQFAFNYAARRDRAIFYGGNLGVSQSTNTFGNYMGKWSFIGRWDFLVTPPTGAHVLTFPGTEYLVNYHRWGDYSAHFGLRERSTDLNTYFEGETPISNPDGQIKDAVLTWSYEIGQTPSRLIFQSIEGTDGGLSTAYSHTLKEHATLLHNGNFGIGVNNPTSTFEYRNLNNNTIITTARNFTNQIIYQMDNNGRFSFNTPINLTGTEQVYIKSNSSTGANTTFQIDDYSGNNILGVQSSGYISLPKLAANIGIPTSPLEEWYLKINGYGLLSAENTATYRWGLDGNTIPSTTPNPKIGTLNLLNLDIITNGISTIKLDGTNHSVYIPSFTSMGTTPSYTNIPSIDWTLGLMERRTTGTDPDFGAFMIRDYGGGKIFYIARDGRRMIAPEFNYNPNPTGFGTEPTLKLGSSGNETYITGNGGESVFSGLITVAKDIIPQSSLFSNLGNSTFAFNDFWTKYTYTTNLNVSGNVGSHLIPSNNNLYDLGSLGNRWRFIYTNNAVSVSDFRLKRDISSLDNADGLKMIMKLKPVNYFWKDNNVDNMKHYGFIAQDLKKLFNNAIVAGSEDSGNMGVMYNEIIPILTRGIQEQQQIIDTLRQQVSLLLANNKSKENMEGISQSEELNQLPLLFQNHPNPFNGITLIDYFLPPNANNAFIRVIDNAGRLIKAFPLKMVGYGQVELDCNNISAGTYHYSLLVNSQQIDSKSMIVLGNN